METNTAVEKQCSNCYQVVAMADKFCVNCGHSLEKHPQCSNCHQAVAVTDKFCVSCGYSLQSEKVVNKKLADPWRRFFARWIDIWIIQLSLIFIIVYWLYVSQSWPEFFLWIHKPGSDTILACILMPLVLIIEGIVFFIFGNTLGKALLKIRITTNAGKNITPEKYSDRLIDVYWNGLGLGLPGISLFTMARQYDRLKNEKKTGYDGAYNVEAESLSMWRKITAGVLVVLLLVLQTIIEGSGK